MNERFGFIHDKLEIKILILFILRRLPEGINIDQLTDLTMCDDGISYFDFIDCVSDLVRTEHINLMDEKYAITDKGRLHGEITESGIPYSVRMKAEKSAAVLSKILKRDALIKTTHELRRGGGCTAQLTLDDTFGEVISMRLMTATEDQAKMLEANFRKNAEKIYNKIINILLSENAD